MVISCEQYEAPCTFSSVGLEHLFYTERVGGSNPSRCTRHTKCGGTGQRFILANSMPKVELPIYGIGFMVVIVLMVSTSDCGSASMGSNPINYPKEVCQSGLSCNFAKVVDFMVPQVRIL